MTDQIASTKIICKGGLDTSENFLLLSDNTPGGATNLVNYESSFQGGYRRINGYVKLNLDFPEVTSVSAPAEGPILGIWGYHNRGANEFQYIACRKLQGADEYQFYKFVPGDAWQEFTTGVTRSSIAVSKIRSVQYVFGNTNYILFVDGVNPLLIFDGTNWDECLVSNTGGLTSPGGPNVLSRPSIIAEFKNTIFIGGDPDYPAVVAYSSPSAPGATEPGFYDWSATKGAGQLVTSFHTVQMYSFRDDLYLFGEVGIKRVVISNLTFVLQDITKNLGCISRDAVFELAGNLLFWSQDGIRIVAGTAKIGDVDLGAITDRIQRLMSQYQESYDLSAVNVLTIRNKTQFRLLISDGTVSDENSIGILGTLLVRPNEGATWEFGKLKGIRASSCWSGYDLNNKEVVLHGGYDGIVYQQEIGSSFDGNPIFSQYETPYIDFGDSRVKKAMKYLSTFVRATGSFDISIAVTYDWGRNDVLNPNDYNVTGVGSLTIYDGGFKYDDPLSKYAGAIQPIVRTNVQGSFYSVKFSFISNGIYAPFTIQGLVIELSPAGR